MDEPRCDPDELARLVRAGDVAGLDQVTRHRDDASLDAWLALSVMERAILLLADEGWTGTEIAARLGLGTVAVRTRLTRARRRLRARL